MKNNNTYPLIVQWIKYCCVDKQGEHLNHKDNAIIAIKNRVFLSTNKQKKHIKRLIQAHIANYIIGKTGSIGLMKMETARTPGKSY